MGQTGRHYLDCVCVSRYVAEGTFLKNYADVLAILMRLRQHCCHPDLLPKMYTDSGKTLQCVSVSTKHTKDDRTLMSSMQN